MEKENIEEVTEEINWQDKYVRLYADVENLKKRHRKEKDEISKNVKLRMVDSILDMDNDLSIAIKSFDSVPDGVNLILSKLKHFLDTQGIKEIPTDEYNPDLHEVVSVIENGESKVVDVVSKGYKMGDTVIRYPKIILSK